jgi:hypothetical protein
MIVRTLRQVPGPAIAIISFANVSPVPPSFAVDFRHQSIVFHDKPGKDETNRKNFPEPRYLERRLLFSLVLRLAVGLTHSKNGSMQKIMTNEKKSF